MYTFYTAVIAFTCAVTVLACDEKPLAAAMTDCTEEEREAKDLKNAKGGSGSCYSGGDGRPQRCLSQPLKREDIVDSYYIDPRKHSDFAIVFWSRTCYYIG